MFVITKAECQGYSAVKKN